jgi:hypothetical protein
MTLGNMHGIEDHSPMVEMPASPFILSLATLITCLLTYNEKI